MIDKGKLKRSRLSRVRLAIERKVEFNTLLTIEECWDRLLTKKYSDKKHVPPFGIVRSLLVILDYTEWTTQTTLEFKMDVKPDIEIPESSGSLCTFIGTIYYQENGTVLIQGRTYVPGALCSFLAAGIMFIISLFMGYGAVIALLNSFLEFFFMLSIFPVVCWFLIGTMLHQYNSVHNILIGAIHSILSSYRKLPLVVGA